MTRRFIFTTLVALITSLSVMPAFAQGAISLAELQISFWPEYDRNATLVIYHGTLDPSTSVPASLTFTIPAQYGPPLAVAYEDAQGRLFNLEYTTAIAGGEMKVTFTVPTSKFQFEYYDSSLVTSSSARHYRFEGVAAYPIQMLILQVQQPVGANGLVTTPSLSTWSTGDGGLNYGRTSHNDVKIGNPITLELSYTKNDLVLSANNAQPVGSAQPTLAPAAAQPAQPIPSVAVLLGLMGALLIGGGAWWYSRARARSVGRPQAKVNGLSTSSEEEAVFCHQCGQRAQPRDSFCRNCGAKLRK